MLSTRHLVVALFAASTVACGSSSDSPGTTTDEDTGTLVEDDTGAVADDTGTTTTDSASDTGSVAKDSGTPADTATPDAACTSKTWYRDGDGDGFGDPAKVMDACTQPSGYVATKTDCDDTKASVNPMAAEVCDKLDNNCDGMVDGTASEAAACTASAGSYAGTYSMYTAEKLGSTVINEMKCLTGTSAITIDLAGMSVVKGTVTCAYPGSLGGFDKTQTGTIDGLLKADGSVEGKLTHKFGSSMTATFSFKGKLVAGKIDVMGTGSWKPNPMSAVPWEVSFSFSATKK